MFDYTTYKFIHIASLIIVFLAIGGLTAAANNAVSRKLFSIIHGIFLIIVFVAGFGLIAKLDLNYPWPIWVWCKLAGWLIVGMAPKFAKSWSPLMTILFYGFIATLMAYLALFKPF